MPGVVVVVVVVVDDDVVDVDVLDKFFRAMAFSFNTSIAILIFPLRHNALSSALKAMTSGVWMV